MTKPLRVLVVDDEPVSRAGIVALLRADPDLTVIGECGDGASAVAAIRRDEPDLVLLDIQMPEMDGFDVVRAIGADRMPPVVFVTAHDRYALDAFRVHRVQVNDGPQTAFQQQCQHVKAGFAIAVVAGVVGLAKVVVERHFRDLITAFFDPLHGFFVRPGMHPALRRGSHIVEPQFHIQIRARSRTKPLTGESPSMFATF